MPRRDLSNARILITGASGGIGRSLALELAKRQTKLLLVARSENELQETARLVRSQGSVCEVVVGDITQSATREAVLDQCLNVYRGLDILINNAGVGALALFEETSAETFRKLMEINFFAAVELTQAALPMLKQGHMPAIVNVGSILGERGLPLYAAYCASKFALHGLSESMRPELRRVGIHVLEVQPGPTKTGFQSRVVQRTKTDWPGGGAVTADYVAQTTVRALISNRMRIVPSFGGYWLLLLNRIAPGLVDWFVTRNNA